MIVELYGPPGVGKTTFAHALAARLRERGFGATLALSYRPSERPNFAGTDGPVRRWFPALRRVSRPVIESFRAARRLPRDSREARAATALRGLFPPHDFVAALKLRQYVLRLSCTWHDSARIDDIVIFDQAFVQLICTLGSLGGATKPDQVEAALAIVPRPDLLVRLAAPTEILEARLVERRRRLSAIESLFELDLKTNFKSLEITDRLHDLLQQRNQFGICVETPDRRSLHAAIDKVEEATLRLRGRPAASPAAAFEGAA